MGWSKVTVEESSNWKVLLRALRSSTAPATGGKQLLVSDFSNEQRSQIAFHIWCTHATNKCVMNRTSSWLWLSVSTIDSEYSWHRDFLLALPWERAVRFSEARTEGVEAGLHEGCLLIHRLPQHRCCRGSHLAGDLLQPVARGHV